MNSKEILQQVLQMAHEEGYRFRSPLSNYLTIRVTAIDPETGRFSVELKSKSQTVIVASSIQLLAFEVGFAKAFFGDYWESHLNLMAIAADKLLYMADRLQHFAVRHVEKEVLANL